jgi:hypothetical protein
VIGGTVSFVVGQLLDLTSIAVTVVRWSASVWFLRMATLFLAQAFDFATFSVMVSRLGPNAEANPLVGHVFGSLGLPALAAAKMSLVVLIGALTIAAMARERRGRVWPVVGGLPMALAIAAGLIGGITNAAVILS